MTTLLSILCSLGVIVNSSNLTDNSPNNSPKSLINSNLEIKDNILNNDLNNDLKIESNLKENYIWYSTKNILNSSNNLIKYLSSNIWYFISLTVSESDKFNYDENSNDENCLNELNNFILKPVYYFI